MATQAINRFKTVPPTPFMLRDILPGPAWAPYQTETNNLTRVAEYLQEHPKEDGNCVRGAVVALGLEVVAGISAFGIWQLWHLFR
ncbi:MAG: hypothetical protein WBQ94_06330 [Terracidiphilus sp.]